MNAHDLSERVLIASVIPYFLERDSFWFEKNFSHILNLRKTQTFWQENILTLEKDQEIKLSTLLRKLEEMGYEKVFKVEGMGEFSHIGGIVEVFPVNLPFSVKIEFFGNRIENILKGKKDNEPEQRELLKKKLKKEKDFSDLKNLKPGEYVVHLDHGVGRFLGKKKLFENLDYFVIEYAHRDRLYVPQTLERKLTRYVGFVEPKLNSLSSVLWLKQKQKAKKDAEIFAKKILQTFARKEMAKRPPLKNSFFEKALAETCPFELTPDQQKAIETLEGDFLKTKPMDRILIGDVGFGKTEIALRAAVRSAENGRQALLIAPTAVLCQQHFESFRERLKNIPLEVGILTRLQTKKEAERVISGIKNGKIDILIATHRALQKNIEFKNLGLLIVDDEQKFGVAQKEFWREKKPDIDVLLISATPIPRTLYMGLLGLKEISFIKTPPPFKKETRTFVKPFCKKIIKKAVEFELKRGGQVYFLYNRVATIKNFEKFLLKINPEWKIAILHGKMKPKEVKSVIEKFKKREFDILLATTIIENGLDIKNVNTLIVADATRLGLAQAHQIRGRIARGEKEGFAYFLYPASSLKGKARGRLAFLKAFSKLSQGYKIAQKDLELRGAGNILGKEQWGTVNKVGLNLYCQMVSETIEKMKIKF